MKRKERIQEVIPVLFSWYTKEARVLPWRETRDPYRVLVSEIMLQQTQVDRVIEKYKEFLTEFPTVQDLVKASTADVIRSWVGLGYNRRALFLQKTARAVVSEYNGVFPADLEKLKALPGLGDYTARAVLSFAFDKAVPMMDTNHRRIYTRLFFGIQEKKDAELIAVGELMGEPMQKMTIAKKVPFGQKQSNMYHWNQMLMDFGSALCTSRSPKCSDCPVQVYCKAYPKSLTAFEKKKKLAKTSKKTPFRDTDRYYRGRIVDLLRQDGEVSITKVHSRFDDIPKERLDKIILQLAKDGLIKIEKKRIVFP
ncbi:A/G-specific adenine glycosylase [Patescibacteria group bacterium]|nr:A/G-specific adenine glycosylase [Patescibacteria group bacterium]MBU1721739.1 A/G-specific adenine glycosylase [Patescibacteria group bacterium]MBU1901422.1 A/G-specific adenine glycosylase [Patescibacteria group bacterium]